MEDIHNQIQRCVPTNVESIIQVVLGGMDAVNFAQYDMRPSDILQEGPRVIVNYFPPDVLLDYTIFRSDFDIWTLGCVAAELFLRHRLSQGPPEASSSERASCPWEPRTNFPTSTPILDAQLLLVPASRPTLDWIVQAHWSGKHYGDHGEDFADIQPPLASLRGCPPGLEISC